MSFYDDTPVLAQVPTGGASCDTQDPLGGRLRHTLRIHTAAYTYGIVYLRVGGTVHLPTSMTADMSASKGSYMPDALLEFCRRYSPPQELANELLAEFLRAEVVI